MPAFGALIAEPLFLFADSVIVGRLGTAPLGGLGVASQALTTLVGISIFLAYGTTAAVARQIGAGHRVAAIRQGVDGLWLAGIIGAVVLAAGWPLAPQIVHAFGGSPGVSAEAAIYLRISLLGAPSMLVVLAGTGVLRGLQDTRTPLTVAVAANVVNVALNAFLVLGLHWGIAGSAWGTVCAQTAGAAAYLAMVGRGARRAGVGFAPDLTGLRAAAVTGVSLIVRTIALQAVLIVVTAVAARQGTAAIAAHQIAFRAWILLAYALDAIAIAGQAITGRYLGAGDVAGARAATNRMIGWGVVYGAGVRGAAGRGHPAAAGRFLGRAGGAAAAARRAAGGGRAAASGGGGVRARRRADRRRGPGLPGAGRAGGGGRVRGRRGAGDRGAWRAGRVVAGVQPVAAGPLRDAHPAGPLLATGSSPARSAASPLPPCGRGTPPPALSPA